MSSWWKTAASAAVAAILVASCTPRPGDETQGKTQAESIGPSRSALAAYLAGRYAQVRGDSKAAAEYYSRALAFDPDNLDLLQRAFTLMVAEGRLDEAHPLALRLLTFDADGAIPLLVDGLYEAKAGRFDKAEARFAALPKRSVNSVLGPLLTAWARNGQGKTDSALESLAPLAQTNGLAALHAFHAGLINDLADRSRAAEDHYLVAVAGQASIRPIEAAGAFFQRIGRIDVAKELYGRYASEHPETLLFDGARLLRAGGAVPKPVPNALSGMAEAFFDIATLMRQSNAPDAALVFSRLAVAAQPDFPLAQMNVADILSSQERFADANAIYRAINPNSPVHTFGRLRVATNLDEAGDTEGAMAELDKLAKDRPDSLDAQVTKGDILRRKKRFAEAAAAYGAAIDKAGKDEPHLWPLYYSRGISYERANQWPKAEADLQKALRLRPDQPDVLNYLGYTWVDKGQNLDVARRMLEKAVELRPKDGAVVDSLGWALYRLGDYPSAVKHLERAIELKPEDPTINDHLGDAYFQVGRIEEALFQWKRATSLDPEPEQIGPLQEKLRTGRPPQ